MILEKINKLKPLFLAILFASSLSMFIVKTSRAEDFTITCAIGGCTDLSTPIFNEKNVYPTLEVSKQIKIINNYPEERNFAVQVSDLNFQDDVDFPLSEKLQIRIYEGANLIYGPKSLKQWKSDDYVILGNKIPSGGNQLFDFKITMDNVGNDYQGKQTKFDLNLGFEEVSEQTNPLLTSSSVGGISTTEAKPSVCSTQIPVSPSNFRLLNSTDNAVTLAWDAVFPVTHYALEFRRVRDGATYGANNIGNITSYTINNLSGGETYNFELFAVNDCAPSNRTYLSNIFVGGIVIPDEIRPTGPNNQILGVQDEDEEETLDQMILGENDQDFCKDNNFIWYLALIIQAIVILILVLFRPEYRKQNILIIITLAIISQILHILFWPCNCVTSNLCNYYSLFNLATVIPNIIFYKKKK